MLPAASRMRRSSDFSSVVRAGSRARTGRLAVHHVAALGADGSSGPVVGFVVSKAVGNSVQRHAVTRRLRAQMTARLGQLPASSGTVVRALPGAASASSAELGRDLDRALAKVTSSRVSGPRLPVTHRHTQSSAGPR